MHSNAVIIATVEGTGGRRSFTEQLSSLIRDAWNRQKGTYIPWEEVKGFLSTELGLAEDKICCAKVSSREWNYYVRLNQDGFKDPIALGVLIVAADPQCRFTEKTLDRIHEKVALPFEWPLLIIEEDPPGGAGFRPTTLILGP